MQNLPGIVSARGLFSMGPNGTLVKDHNTLFKGDKNL